MAQAACHQRHVTLSDDHHRGGRQRRPRPRPRVTPLTGQPNRRGSSWRSRDRHPTLGYGPPCSWRPSSSSGTSTTTPTRVLLPLRQPALAGAVADVRGHESKTRRAPGAVRADAEAARRGDARWSFPLYASAPDRGQEGRAGLGGGVVPHPRRGGARRRRWYRPTVDTALTCTICCCLRSRSEPGCSRRSGARA